MRIVSLFCGAGGLDLGLIQAGHEIIWANDNDPDAVATYRHNIGKHVVLSDITDVPSCDIPVCDVVVGGFPCQGFSQANRLRAPEDVRNTLYTEFLRVVRDKKPKWFLAENVRGILSLGGGAVMERIENDFRRAGFRVDKRLLNAASFGVPQNRHRVIIAGTREDLPPNLDYPFPMPTHDANQKAGLLFKEGRLLPYLTVGDALKDIPEPSEDCAIPNHIYSRYKVTDRDFQGHRQTDPKKPSPTILARGNGKGGVCAMQHPNNHRRMSVRESASIQTFPLDFQFFGSMTSCYRQVGNAVAVEFARALGKQLNALERMASS
ncbi:modification methylase BspRI [Abditibacteriota bacterium]|nr:modification methylase BspRI [Abditibacteriota bacterium]